MLKFVFVFLFMCGCAASLNVALEEKGEAIKKRQAEVDKSTNETIASWEGKAILLNAGDSQPENRVCLVFHQSPAKCELVGADSPNGRQKIVGNCTAGILNIVDLDSIFSHIFFDCLTDSGDSCTGKGKDKFLDSQMVDKTPPRASDAEFKSPSGRPVITISDSNTCEKIEKQSQTRADVVSSISALWEGGQMFVTGSKSCLTFSQKPNECLLSSKELKDARGTCAISYYVSQYGFLTFRVKIDDGKQTKNSEQDVFNSIVRSYLVGDEKEISGSSNTIRAAQTGECAQQQ